MAKVFRKAAEAAAAALHIDWRRLRVEEIEQGIIMVNWSDSMTITKEQERAVKAAVRAALPEKYRDRPIEIT